MTRPAALLLVGPTGSGKTPLGDCLEQHGLWGRRCAHFDFGRELRHAAAGGRPGLLAPGDVPFLRTVLREGLLLEDQHFHLARKLLAHFLHEHTPPAATPDPLVVLNGLPRHLGQARDVHEMVNVVVVVHLECSPETAWERIRSNAGGDRTGRADDHPDSARRRHALYEARARPLIDHYRARGARIDAFDVGPDTTAEQIRAALNRAPRL